MTLLGSRGPVLPRAWRLVVYDVTLATLREPRLSDMFWVSLRIEAQGVALDPRLRDPEFWLGDSWRLVDAETGVPEPHVLAATGPLDAGGRIRLRGFLPR